MDWFKRHRPALVVVAVFALALGGAAVWVIPQVAEGFSLWGIFGGPDATFPNYSTDPVFANLRQRGIGFNNPDANCNVPSEVVTKPVQPPMRIYAYTPRDFAVFPTGNPPVVFRGFTTKGLTIVSISGYTGPIRLKGLEIGGGLPGTWLVFGQPGGKNVDTLAFKVAPNQLRRIELKPPKRGCYVLQVDGNDFVEDVYFKAG
jgi:hypothetical protein